MSITAETAKQHAHDPAVLCCRAEAGITIGPENPVSYTHLRAHET